MHSARPTAPTVVIIIVFLVGDDEQAGSRLWETIDGIVTRCASLSPAVRCI